MKNIVVLISGNGSNLQAIIDAIEAKQIDGCITCVISNRPQAYGLQRAQNHGITSLCLNHQDYESREGYDQALLEAITSYHADLVVLAGFMRILTPEFVNALSGKILNIHPSLLPKYKGLNTHQRAIDNRDEMHGPTVHFVTPELDGGPIIAQKPIAILDNDNAESLSERVQVEERRLYPEVVKWFCEERLTMKGNVAYLDGTGI
jgi:phosphoribosylglycinamide formyltransferase-1